MDLQLFETPDNALEAVKRISDNLHHLENVIVNPSRGLDQGRQEALQSKIDSVDAELTRLKLSCLCLNLKPNHHRLPEVAFRALDRLNRISDQFRSLKKKESQPALSAAELHSRQRQAQQVVSETKRALLRISSDLSDLFYMWRKHGSVG
ncbi:MAG: hypothetical protein JRI76_09495 [Deltaproteobacteria bacterium]|nr:hypothetical protein [Deltaproteobacteria bacterium]